MIKWIRSLAVSSVVLLLLSCMNQAMTIKHVQSSSCKMQCLKQRHTCQQICHNDCYTCFKEVQKTVKRSYDQYIREVKTQGGVIARDLNSFKDPLQCRKTSCDCSADFEVCAQSCKGLIHKNMRVPSACC